MVVAGQGADERKPEMPAGDGFGDVLLAARAASAEDQNPEDPTLEHVQGRWSGVEGHVA